MGRLSPNQPIKVQERLTPIIGRGDKISFWLDNWAAEVPLRVLFPNLFAIETEKQCKVMDRYTYNQGKAVWFWGSNHTISSNDLAIEWGECLSLIEKVNIQLKDDNWQWKTDAVAENFTVSKLRSELDHNDTLNETRVIKWLHWIPKKVNCFLWRVVLDRLATKEALQLRNIPLTSNSCPFCNIAVESFSKNVIYVSTSFLAYHEFYSFLDSGDYSTVPAIPGYGWIKPSQQFWFQQTSMKLQRKSKAPGLAYFHIPLPEYSSFDSSSYTGVELEPGNPPISSASVNSGFFTTLVGAGDVKAVFVGHDHINDFCGELTGINLCYAGGFGYHAYGKAGWSRRSRVVVASLEKKSNGSWGAVEFIKTYKRLDDGNLTVIDNQVLWTKTPSMKW
ncbi:uncharacterized protein LOC118483957 [Helianthus annuus]|uniref:uncharacterized protein LOC118483957 n=1 Tax=Helianthus annuus TaxID=4232 RepID=UPI0016531081|nr:uncharacterized protein LOC118483957 [Helianthus annuus]